MWYKFLNHCCECDSAVRLITRCLCVRMGSDLKKVYACQNKRNTNTYYLHRFGVFFFVTDYKVE